MSEEVGHHYGRVHLNQDGQLVVPPGAHGVMYQNVSYTTSRSTAVSGGTISNRGMTIITTTAVGTLRLDNPVYGVEKTIVWGSTASRLVKLRVTPLVDTDDTVKIGGFLGKVNPNKGVTCVYPSTDCLKLKFATNKYGPAPAITLVGYSTARWIVKAVFPMGTTNIAQPWVFATST